MANFIGGSAMAVRGGDSRKKSERLFGSKAEAKHCANSNLNFANANCDVCSFAATKLRLTRT